MRNISNRMIEMEKIRVFTAFSGYDSQCLALEKEIWKDIYGFEGKYQVSNYGRVQSLSCYITVVLPTGKIYKRWHKGRLLIQKKDKNGYCIVSLGKNSRKVHRLVAMAFCYGYKPNKQVNHKDENKANNHSNNLEWCDSLYNNRYGGHIIRAAKGHCKSIVQMNMQGQIIAKYESLISAEKALGITNASTPICRCCRGKIKKAYGYKWSYV